MNCLVVAKIVASALPSCQWIKIMLLIIEPQRLVVLGSTEHFTMVGKLRIHKIRKKGGIVSYLYRQNKGRGEEQHLLGGFKPTAYSMGQ